VTIRSKHLIGGLIWLALTGGAVPTAAAECPGNPNALGTSRTLVIDPAEHARLGTMQYSESLPLADHEVVLTFDDGPLPPYSTRILNVLAAECVKVNYFLVGRMAHTFPDLVRRIRDEGHTIGTHTQNHPLAMDKMPLAAAQKEIDDGIASVTAAVGDPKAVAPFFRVPGLARTAAIESYVAGRGLDTWSADFPADDWFKRISASEVLRRALSRLEARHKGVLLLHDIQPATALMLPTLLKELKARGYRIVQVVPATTERPKTPTAPQQWVGGRGKNTAIASLSFRLPVRPENFGIGTSYPYGPSMIVAPNIEHRRVFAAAGDFPLPPMSPWSRYDQPAMPNDMATAAVSGPVLDWPKIPQDYETMLVRTEAVAWPMRPALHSPLPRRAKAKARAKIPATAVRPVAAKRRVPAKPMRPRVATAAP
jgi:peptidoglycan/xylan/chitin deacetylase (PgdA/CDA1 family)